MEKANLCIDKSIIVENEFIMQVMAHVNEC